MLIRPYYVGEDLSELDYPMEYNWESPPDDLVIKVLVMKTPAAFVSYKFANEQTLQIQKLGVHENVRRLKLGTTLMAHVVKRAFATGSRRLRMTLPESNIIGAYFLASCGFEGKLVRGSESDFIKFERPVIR